MKPSLFCAAVMAACFSSTAGEPSGWITLFDGKSLEGWKVVSHPKDQGISFWRVEDGAIVCDSRGKPDHDYVWLVNQGEYSDFELRLSVRASRQFSGNSGVQVRSRYDHEAFWMNGPQVDIHPPAPWRAGLIYDETRETRRWIFPSLKDWDIAQSQGPGKWRWNDDGWNQIQVTCQGTRITTEVNGIRIADYDGKGVLDDDAHRRHRVGLSGHVALQLHQRDELFLQVKGIRIRPTN